MGGHARDTEVTRGVSLSQTAYVAGSALVFRALGSPRRGPAAARCGDGARGLTPRPLLPQICSLLCAGAEARCV